MTHLLLDVFFFLKKEDGFCCRRFHEGQQNVLEVIDLCAFKEFPSSGLRLVFQEELCPFSFLCAREVGSLMILM